MKSRVITSVSKANKAIAGRTIVRVELNQIAEDDGSTSSGYPILVLDDGAEITFNVKDYGSGTYGLDLVRKTK